MKAGKVLSSFLMAAGIFMLFGGASLSDIGFVIIGIIELILSILWKRSIEKQLNQIKQKEEEEEKNKKIAEWNHKKIEFYEELCESKCVELNTVAKKEKAKLIARKYTEINSDEDFEEFLILAKTEYDKKVEQERQLKLESILNKEKEFYEKTVKYAFLYGREKRKQYLLESLRKYIDDKEHHSRLAGYAKTTGMNANTLTGANRDWAVAGGIASAIAGPAAGVATALDVQNKNAIAQQNADELRTSAINVMIQQEMLANKDTKKIEAVQKEIGNIDSKLVSDENPEHLFEQLCPTVTSQSVTETGALKATISIQMAKTKIYDEVDAFIDGTIKGEILNNGKLVGEMIFCLNEKGSLYDDSIDGICTTLKEPNASYELVLKPNILWAIEI